MRWINSIYNKSSYETLKSFNLYSEQELKVLKKEYNSYPSMAILKEYHKNTTNNNIRQLQNANLPVNLPVLHFRATKPINIVSEYMGMDTISIIKQTVTNDEIQKIETIEGSHETIFLERINEIVEKTNQFIVSIK